jgi:hypothetical protein
MVHQQQAAMLVLDRDAGWQVPEHVLEKVQFGVARASVIGLARIRP